jgi:hypothetical protein
VCILQYSLAPFVLSLRICTLHMQQQCNDICSTGAQTEGSVCNLQNSLATFVSSFRASAPYTYTHDAATKSASVRLSAAILHAPLQLEYQTKDIQHTAGTLNPHLGLRFWQDS